MMAKTNTRTTLSDSKLKKFIKTESSGPYSHVAICPGKTCSVKYWTNRPDKGVSFLRTHIQAKHLQEMGGELVSGKRKTKS